MQSHGRNYYQVCTRCIMDTTDPEIVFDDEGVCNHCRRFDSVGRPRLIGGAEGRRRLDAWVQTIKDAGKGKDYDCIMGLSGGVDSTFVAYHAKRLGLRPLAVHMDNGWNSEMAVRNIERTVRKLDIDLYTEVLDWEEFRDIQRAFFKASVVNIEMITDHAIFAVILRLAAKHGIKYSLSGSNVATEGILPKAWSYDHEDARNILAIHKRFGERPLKRFPTLSLAENAFIRKVKGIKTLSMLDFLDYDKDAAIETLKNELAWEYYGGKHYESIFTRFFQGYFLPRKFGFDKRLAHLSTLVNSGQLTRDQALAEMSKPAYPQALMEEDLRYVREKLGFSEQEFEELMARPPVPHTAFPNQQKAQALLSRLAAAIRR